MYRYKLEVSPWYDTVLGAVAIIASIVGSIEDFWFNSHMSLFFYVTSSILCYIYASLRILSTIIGSVQYLRSDADIRPVFSDWITALIQGHLVTIEVIEVPTSIAF